MNSRHQRQPRHRPGWSARTLLRYSLLQLPALVLVVVVLVFIQRWMPLPAWLLWSIIAVWILKDAVLFPVVWRAYEPEQSTLPPGLLGAVGITRERLAPSGYIRVHGVLWRAEVADTDATLEPGTPVRITARHGLTLRVVPHDDHPAEPE